MECGVWSVECSLWKSVECRVRKSIAPATPNDFPHVRRHMGMSRTAAPVTQNHFTTGFETLKQDRFCSFPYRHGDVSRKPETLSARYQRGWNVTKCHACHAKQHDNLLGNLRKGEVLQLPPFVARLLRIFTLCSFKIDVFLGVFLRT